MQPRYFFGGQVQSLAGLLQPEQTLLFIGRPHFLHGEHPHAWHMRHLVKIVIVWLSYYPFQSGAGQAEIAQPQERFGDFYAGLCAGNPAGVLSHFFPFVVVLH